MGEPMRHGTFVALSFLLSSLPLCSLCLCGSQKKLDPAAWGSDHVGKPVPEFVTSSECLFCHRNDVGPSWSTNRHRRTVREADTEQAALASLKRPTADEVKLVLGGGNRVRFLKPGAEYGKLDLLSVEWQPPRGSESGKLLQADKPHWDAKKFGDACAGCHATAVDVKMRAASVVALDCYACHGNVDLNHSKDTSMVYLAKKRNDPPRVITSICAQCHIRTGHSKSTRLPYANNFVAGDNLFRDFQVDFSDDAIRRLNPGDRHVLENVRDVVLHGNEDVTCLTCHDVHKQSSKKHHIVPKGDICWNCHEPKESMKVRKKYAVHSITCGY